MSASAVSNQIAFRYRAVDSHAGVTRQTVKRLAEYRDTDETQTIHCALRELALRVLPQYEPDDGPLTTSQLRQIRQLARPGDQRALRSSLFETTG